MNEMRIDFGELKNIVEASILTSELPISIQQLHSLFAPEHEVEVLEIERALFELQREYVNRGIELKRISRGYRFQSCEQYASWIQKLNEARPRRYSRALLETLSIIAYRQPVTRGDIESIRGVSVSTDIMRVLLHNEWIRQTGFRQVPGRPALFGTTEKFLEDFNMETLADLPALDERNETDEGVDSEISQATEN